MFGLVGRNAQIGLMLALGFYLKRSRAEVVP